MNYRDWLQQVIYKIINPVVRGMIKIGITPNFITTTGLILNIVAAGIFIYAGLVTDSEEDDAECLILKETGVEEQTDKMYEIVEDDTELLAVSKVFEELLEDVSIGM